MYKPYLFSRHSHVPREHRLLFDVENLGNKEPQHTPLTAWEKTGIPGSGMWADAAEGAKKKIDEANAINAPLINTGKNFGQSVIDAAPPWVKEGIANMKNRPSQPEPGKPKRNKPDFSVERQQVALREKYDAILSELRLGVVLLEDSEKSDADRTALRAKIFKAMCDCRQDQLGLEGEPDAKKQEALFKEIDRQFKDLEKVYDDALRFKTVEGMQRYHTILKGEFEAEAAQASAANKPLPYEFFVFKLGQETRRTRMERERETRTKPSLRPVGSPTTSTVLEAHGADIETFRRRLTGIR